MFHQNLYLHSFGACLKWESEGVIGYRYNKKKNRTVVKRCGLRKSMSHVLSIFGDDSFQSLNTFFKIVDL